LLLSVWKRFAVPYNVHCKNSITMKIHATCTEATERLWVPCGLCQLHWQQTEGDKGSLLEEDLSMCQGHSFMKVS
jgi:hypothetical protein